MFTHPLAKIIFLFTLAALSAVGSTITAPNLGTASTFGLLAGTVSNSGVSSVGGNVGAVNTVTGFPPGTATGTVFSSDIPQVSNAFNDFVSAYNFAISDSSTAPTQTLVTGLTANQSFTGNNVYSFSGQTLTSTAGITLTFDAQNNSSDVFIMKDINDMTILGPITFNLIDGAMAGNIYWIIGDTATISPSEVPITWDGSILAKTSFTMSANTGGSDVLAGTINGCVYAQNGTATLAGKTIINGCSASSIPPGVPEPGTLGLAALSCLAGLLWWKGGIGRSVAAAKISADAEGK